MALISLYSLSPFSIKVSTSCIYVRYLVNSDDRSLGTREKRVCIYFWCMYFENCLVSEFWLRDFEIVSANICLKIFTMCEIFQREGNSILTICKFLRVEHISVTCAVNKQLFLFLLIYLRVYNSNNVPNLEKNTRKDMMNYKTYFIWEKNNRSLSYCICFLFFLIFYYDTLIFKLADMGNSPTVEVYITSADVASGDVVGFFCGHGNQGRLKSRPVPNLKVPGFKKKDIIRDKDLRKFEEIDNHALNVRLNT